MSENSITFGKRNEAIRRYIKNFEEIETEIKNDYSYAVLYRLSEVKIIPAEMFEGLKNEPELREAVFFNEDKELRVFYYNGKLRGSVISDSPEYKADLCSKRKIMLKGEYKNKTLKVMEYIDYDEDGQAFVDTTRICGIE